MEAKDSKNQQKKAGKPNDHNVLYEKMKDFKTKFPEATDNDEFFKGLYSRLRKYTKKLNKLAESKDKNQDSNEAKENKAKKKDLELSMDEMTGIIGEYMRHFDNHCEQIWSMKETSHHEQAEVHKEEEDEVQPEPEPIQAEPQIDIEAIRDEEYQKGFEKGRNAGYEDGKAEGYTQGKNDGYLQAQHENQAKEEGTNVEQVQKAIKYASLISIMACWIDSFTPMEPAFKKNDYFTDEECNAIRKLYFSIHTIQPQINFNTLVAENTNRVSKLVLKNEENLLNTPNVTYKSLAETFDRVLENQKFIQTTHQMMPTMQEFNMGMGMYAQMQGSVPGQIISQSPSMMAASHTTSSINQTHVEVKQSEPRQESQRIEEQPAFIVEEEKHNLNAKSEQMQELGQTFQVNTVEEVNWNDHDDHEDDDDDHEDSDSNDDDGDDHEEHNKENQDFGRPEEVHATPEGQEAQEQANQESKPYNKRGGGYRGRGRGRGGRYGYNRGYNNYYHQRGFQGESRGQRRGGRYRESRGGRGKYNDYYEGNYNYPSYDHPEYHEDQKEVKPAEPAPKMDEDGFEFVKEKTYNMNKKKARKSKKI
jgi:hypothetical protein